MPASRHHSGGSTRSGPTTRHSAVLSWFVVVLVGALVLILVFGLQLFPRLDAGQQVLNQADPIFAPNRAAADPAGINMVSKVVNLADPIMLPSGGATSDISNLVTFVSLQTGLTPQQIGTALSARFPNLTALLEAAPLSADTAELPNFLNYVGSLLDMTPAQVTAILPVAFPHLAQSVVALPKETAGWDSPPGMAGLTNFSGVPLHTVPQLQSYLQNEVIPQVPAQAGNFHSLKNGWPQVHIIPWILLITGVVVIVFGLLMMLRAWLGNPGRREATATWGIVAIVGVLVLVLVFGFSLYPRLDNGNKLLTGLSPVFSQNRPQGDAAGVAMISNSVNLLDPVMTPQGGAAAEIKDLISFISVQTGLSQARVLANLSSRFPQVTALLEAVPFTAAAAELPGFLAFAGTLLHLTPAQVTAIVPVAFPHLAQSAANLPAVTGGWENIPGISGLTNFSGAPVTTVVQLRNYFAGDVIPIAVSQDANFMKVSTTTPPVSWFPTLLFLVGLLVIVYALAMIVVVRKVMVRTEPRLGAHGSA